MTAKRLENYTGIKNELDHLRELMRVFDAIYEATEIRLDDDLLQRYRDTISRLSDELIEIERAIETLEPRERQALRLHYIDGLSWEEVGYRMYYERSQIYRIRKIALEKLKNA